jgi:hypothetical protein
MKPEEYAAHFRDYWRIKEKMLHDGGIEGSDSFFDLLKTVAKDAFDYALTLDKGD